MYDINFIGQRIVPESHQKVKMIVTSVSAVTLGVTLVAMLTMVVSDLGASEVYASDVTRLQRRASELYGEMPTRASLAEIIKDTEPDLREVGKLADRRTQFSDLWEQVATAVPDGVWLTRVSMADPRSSEEDAHRTRKHKQQSFRGIVIEGVAIAGSGPEGDQAVSQFQENLEGNSELTSKITAFEFVGTGLEQIGGTSVVGFEISCPM